jgi:hypothetical protein
MATQAILGLFEDANAAADAGDALKSAGVAESDYHFLTDVPYPEGAFGERMEKHRLFWWPLVGGAVGIIVALIVTGMTPLAVPMTTGDKPILALPPLAVICYTGAILGAILFAVIGLALALRPNFRNGLSDDRISRGMIGVLVNAGAEQGPRVTEILSKAGAVDVTSGRA